MAKSILEACVEEGLVKGELRFGRSILRGLLTDRFGPLPEAVSQQIDAVTDPARLQAAALQVPRLGKLEDLGL